MKKIVTYLIMGILAVGLVSCKPAGPKVEPVYKGEGTYDASAVQEVVINDLIKTPEKYAGTFVSLTGKIVTECSVGCWFFLADEAGNQIHVDLAPQNFNIPQAVGKKVKVIGLFEAAESNLKLSGFVVEFIN